MSLQIDAQECLLEAIADRNGVDIPPDQMGSLKPSDPQIGAPTGLAWQQTLDNATGRLRAKSYPTRPTTLGRATSLLDKPLTGSQAYLEELSRSPFRLSNVLFWSGATAATAMLAYTVHRYARRRR